jgi:hypothetical protein
MTCSMQAAVTIRPPTACATSSTCESRPHSPRTEADAAFTAAKTEMPQLK